MIVHKNVSENIIKRGWHHLAQVFQGRSLLAEKDFTREELEYLIDFSAHLKDLKKRNIPHRYLEGKKICLLFEKASTRTRAAFTVASIDLGAHPEYLGKSDIQLGKKESVEDTAKVSAACLTASNSAASAKKRLKIWRSSQAYLCGTA